MTYATLLTTLTLVLVLYPFLGAEQYRTVIAFVLAPAILFAGALAASRSPRTRRIALVLLLGVIAGEGIARVDGSLGAIVLVRVGNALFLAFVTWVMVRHIAQATRVTTDIILGSICVYLLIGICFYYVYCVIELLVPGAFQVGGVALTGSGEEAGLGRFPVLVYYSYVTLTTLGYGDIHPIAPFARSLATLEAVTGQLYLAILIARLVGAHLTQTREKPPAP